MTEENRKPSPFSEFRRELWVPRMLFPYRIRERLLSRTFRKRMGYRMDFQNPQTFNEKICWCKLYYYHPDASRIADKASFKAYVAGKLGEGHTARLYGVWNNTDDIDFSGIPVPFVLKSNCSAWGKNIRFIFDRQQIDAETLKKELKEWLSPLNSEITSYARGYHGIKEPLIIAEEYIGSGQEPPIDYKIFCFEGIPRYAYSASGHFRNGKAVSSAISFYDMDWNILNVGYAGSERCEVPKPVHFDEMVRAAGLLAGGFPFMRVDFYDCNDKWYVGEMTFSSGGGYKKFEPESFDRVLGDLFPLPPKNTDPQKFRGDLLLAYFRHVAGAFRKMIRGT